MKIIAPVTPRNCSRCPRLNKLQKYLLLLVLLLPRLLSVFAGRRVAKASRNGIIYIRSRCESETRARRGLGRGWHWERTETNALFNGFLNRKHAKCDLNMHDELPHTHLKPFEKLDSQIHLRTDRVDRWKSKMDFNARCGKSQMACNQMIVQEEEEEKRINRNAANGVFRAHSFAFRFPIHSTPFNRIFLIYFHYASQACAHGVSLALPWLAESCACAP